MKKYIILICSVVFSIGVTTCTNEGMEFDKNGGNGLSFVHFVGSRLSIGAEQDLPETHKTTVKVSSTVKSDAARTYTLKVDGTSSAIEGTHFTMSSKTVTIPANQYAGEVTITADIDKLDQSGVSLKLILESDEAIDYGRNMEVIMRLVCTFTPSLLVGDYKYESEDWEEEGDGLTFEADPEDPLKIYITGYPQSEGLSGNGNRIELNVNPNNYTVSGPKVCIADDLAEWGLATYLNYSFEAVSGTFDPCTSTYVISFVISVNLGSFGENEFIFTKVK